jgi:type IX secretion system PorP/SprF family membrane protein
MLKKMKKLKKIVGIVVFTCIGFSLHAQQQGQFSQYMMNYFLINPAVAGTEDFVDVRAGYRSQWAGLTGSPQNYYVSGHFPINKLHSSMRKQVKKKQAHHSMGGFVSGQTLGALSHKSAYLSYAYHLPLSSKWDLSMGAMGGFNQLSVDPNALNFGDNINDPAAASSANKTKFDMGLGIWLYSDKLFFGLSSMQILQNKIDFSGGLDVATNKGMLNRHYYLTGGYKFQVNKEVQIIPSILLKNTVTAFQMDINTKVRYKNLFWGGMSYRKQDAIVLLAGVGIPLGQSRPGSGVGRNGSSSRLEIGYSYDLVTSKLNAYSKGSHEIMLALILPMGGRVVCPSNYW